MEISLTTPALLFSVISLLSLGYTNRFLALSNLIRNLKKDYLESKNPKLILQIKSLRTRLYMIRNMQMFGIFSILFSVICMFFIFQGYMDLAKTFFQVSLTSMIISLMLSLYEIFISTKALEMHLSDFEEIQ